MPPATARFMTQWGLIGLALGLIVYDEWVYRTFGVQATISDVMCAWGYQRPWLLVILGALLWHFFGVGPRG